MSGMTIGSDAVRADATWVRGFADEISEISWPTVGLAESEVARAVAVVRPGLPDLATSLRSWADAAVAAADELESADRRTDARLAPR